MKNSRRESSPNTIAIRHLTPSMRIWLWIDTALVLFTGIQLFVFTEFTDRFFAWTIINPLTAAFLGASYWASVPLMFLSSRETAWAHARLAVFGVLAFTVLTLIATLLHLDRFHLTDSNPTAQFAGWVWLAVYVIAPVALAIVTFFQLRISGKDPERKAPMLGWFRFLLLAQALVMIGFGIALFLNPAAPLWPWLLTPLTGRAIASWLVGIGLIAAHACLEDDWGRVRTMMIGYTTLAVLQFVALARYGTLVDWSKPHGLLYIVFLASILLVGLYGWLAAQRTSEVQNN